MNGIVSLTTHAARANAIAPTLWPLLRQADSAGLRLCISMQEDAVGLLPDNVRRYADSGRIEILTDRRDHGSNMKYTLAMRRYPDLPIVVVDDDNIFFDGTLAGMVNVWHRRMPRSIICRRYRKIKWRQDGHLDRFTFGSYPIMDCRSLPPETAVFVHDGFPEHCAGVLYPPGCFDVTDAVVDEALAKAPHDDDVFAHVLALRFGVETVHIHDPAYLRVQRDYIDVQIKSTGLWRNGNEGERSDATLRRFEDELAKDRR